MIYVVLGMHKSGTTLVSQMLHKSGVSMGEEFDEGISYDEGNQWERRESFLINLDIVRCSEAAYYSLDQYTGADPPIADALRDRMQRLIEAAEARGGDWGFKDPLTCLTYPIWRTVLPAHRLIGVYRGPHEVMRHYRVRDFDPLHARRVLRAWTAYNAGVVDALEHAALPGLLLRYEALMREERELERFASFLARPLVDTRRPSEHRAKRGHPLFVPVAAAMAVLGGGAPRALLADLDRIREGQAAQPAARS